MESTGYGLNSASYVNYDEIPFGIHILKSVNSYFVVVCKIPLLTTTKEKRLNDFRFFYTGVTSRDRLVLRVRVRTISLLKKWVDMSWIRKLTRSFVVFTYCRWRTPVKWETKETVEQAEDRLGTDIVFNGSTIR